MKKGILGLLVGGYLFVGGFINHDRDYTIRAVHDTPASFRHYDDSGGENAAYGRAVAGAALMTWSIQHLWNKSDFAKPRKPSSKFRETLHLFAGTGMGVTGLFLHELGGNYDQTLVMENSYGSPRTRDVLSPRREHLGFIISTMGTAMATYSAKELWNR